MSASIFEEYSKLMNELLLLRETEGGTLSDEIESTYVERLDALWWQLSEEEQNAYERELALSDSPQSPESLSFVDCEVPLGTKTHPRRAA